jgi:hypothetical protein
MPMNFQPCASSFGELIADQDRFRQVVDIVLDVVVAPDLRQLGDIERAVVEGDAAWAVQVGGDHLDLALAVLLADGMHLADETRANEHSALITDTHLAGIGDAAGKNLDLEAVRRFELGDGQGGELPAPDFRKIAERTQGGAAQVFACQELTS